MGYDGDRDARFGGTLPELTDASDGTRVYMTVEGSRARGFDRVSSTHFEVEVGERLVQLYDHGAGAWFAFNGTSDVTRRLQRLMHAF